MKRRLPNLFRSKKEKSRAKSKAFYRAFEALEDRHMMAASIGPITIHAAPIFPPSINGPAASLMAGVSDGTLYIRGTDSADTITLRQTNDAIKIDGVTGSFGINEFQKIVVRSFGGNDIINLKSEAVRGQLAITKPTEIWSGAGADQVTGGRGNDSVFAEDDNDKVWGNYGDDIIDGGANDDELQGEAGYDKIFGDLGADTLWGGDNDDYLVGGDGVDTLYGGKGYDRLDGSLGYDYLYGQEDYDYLQDDSALKSDSGATFFSNTSFVCGWFDRNVLDASLRTAARDDYASNFAISKTEMMDIFRAAEDGYTVDTVEYGDLQHLVANVAVTMPDYVRDLANSVVNFDFANYYFQGTFLGTGSLAAGDTSQHLEKLVDKWFLGLDRPLAQYKINGAMHNATYQFVQGSLFQDGINYTDIGQGMLGDCYFLAALGSLAVQNPSMIQSMFIDNGDNTFTVRFYHGGAAHYVTVDRFLPTSNADDAIYFADDRLFASFGTDKDNTTNELWVALAEKAYAQLNESGWIGQDDTNSYEGINGGWPAAVMAQLTGWDAHQSSMYSPSPIDRSGRPTTTFSSDQIISKLNSGKLLALDTPEVPLNSTIVGTHAYTVVGFDATTGKFKLFNPWGLNRDSYSLAANPATLDLTWSEIVSNFSGWSYT